MSTHTQHTLSCLDDSSGTLVCKITDAGAATPRSRGKLIAPTPETETERNGVRFRWQIFSSRAKPSAIGWAASDRGWLYLRAPEDHPDWWKFKHRRSYVAEQLAVGYYVKGQEIEGRFSASAYLYRLREPSGLVSDTRLGYREFDTSSEARDWLEETVSRAVHKEAPGLSPGLLTMKRPPRSAVPEAQAKARAEAGYCSVPRCPFIIGPRRHHPPLPGERTLCDKHERKDT